MATSTPTVPPAPPVPPVPQPSSTQQQQKSFDVSQLPSLIKDGMSIQEEAVKRRKTCRFIEEAGRILKLPRVAIATAMVFFHRFYAKHAFSDHDRFEVAVACIILAAKTEESPKKITNVIDECHKLKIRGMQAGRLSAPPPGSNTPPPPGSSNQQNLDPKGEDFIKLKERILLLERVLLHTIGFELSIDHPYKFLVEIIKKLVYNRKLEFIDSNKDSNTNTNPSQQRDKLMNQLVQWAMNFANDSMHTSLCLQFDPQEIAIATVYLAGQFAKVQPIANSTNETWITLLNEPDIETLVSISLQIIDLIADRKGVDNMLFNTIKRNLENLHNEKKNNKNNNSSSNVVVTSEIISTTTATSEPDAKRQRQS